MTQFMSGKKGLIMGVANGNSIAAGIARKLAEQGAELAFTYQGEGLEARVRDVAKECGSEYCLPCDVAVDGQLNAVFDDLTSKWGKLDFVIHSLAFADKDELKGRFIDTSLDNFKNSLHISCYSFVETARLAEPLMTDGGSLVTLSYAGAERVMPNYNLMGISKAALEHSVRYIARDLGENNIRVNAISAGPMRTLAGAAIAGGRFTLKWQGENSPLQDNITLEDVAGTALYLTSDLSAGTTGEIVHVDGGYHTIGMVNINNYE